MSNLNLSIIIPSLGEDSLKKILNNIIHSSVLPKEVIVCLPEDKYHSYVTEYNQNKKIKFNLFFLKTKIKSQVYQRLEAFKFSKNNNILQLDDDIFFDKFFLNNFYSTYLKLTNSNRNKSICLGPTYKYLNNNKFVHSYGFYHRNNLSKFIYNLYFFFFHKFPFGYRKLGKVSCNSVSFGVCISAENINFVKTDWLPGGMILMDRKYFIDYIYHDLNLKKEFTEDIISSYLRRRDKNVQHMVSTKNIVYIESPKKIFSLQSEFDEFRSRLLYIKITKGSYLYFFLWYLFYFFIKNLKKIYDRK